MSEWTKTPPTEYGYWFGRKSKKEPPFVLNILQLPNGVVASINVMGDIKGLPIDIEWWTTKIEEPK